MISGLRPYVDMKDSGIKELGRVPAHWEVVALRRKLRLYDGIKIGPFGSQLKLDEMTTSGYKVYGQANVISNDFGLGTKYVDEYKFNELSACAVVPGDLLVTMMGTSGRCALVPDDAELGIMDSHLLRIRLGTDANTQFAKRLIDEAPYLKHQIVVAGKGSIMHGLNSSIVKALVLAWPPPSEQAAILQFLIHADRGFRRYTRIKQRLFFDEVVDAMHQQSGLLYEFRTRLLADVVTGKLDVREVAETLPESEFDTEVDIEGRTCPSTRLDVD